MSDRPEAEARGEPKPKKTRAKRKVAEPETAGASPKRPASAELTALTKAFESGDYAFVRREAPRFAKRTDDDGERASARELLRRIEPDPMAKWFFGGAALLLVFLASWYWTHPHGGP